MNYVAPHLRETKKELKAPLETYSEMVDNTSVVTNSPYGRLDSLATLRLGKNLPFLEPTAIQRYAIPILMNSHPLLCRAPTGMGKTLCFLLPLMENLKYAQGTRICVISPTRELCEQIKEEALRIGKNLRVESAYGGTSALPTYKNVNVLVAAPGRLLDLLRTGKVSFTYLDSFVLDEADKLLEMGFEKDIRSIKEFVNADTNVYLFSATFHKNLGKVIGDFLPPNKCVVEIEKETIENIKQEVVRVRDKDAKLKEILASLDLGAKWKEGKIPERCLVFVERKLTASALEEKIRGWGHTVASIHGDKEQADRQVALSRFKKGGLPILVATSVAARGIDVSDIKLVVNYDFPREIKEYIHRIGRTGRQGKDGASISFVDSSDMTSEMRSDLVQVLRESKNVVPDFLLREGTVSRKPMENKDRRTTRVYKTENKRDPLTQEMKSLSVKSSESAVCDEKSDSEDDVPGDW